MRAYLAPHDAVRSLWASVTPHDELHYLMGIGPPGHVCGTTRNPGQRESILFFRRFWGVDRSSAARLLVEPWEQRGSVMVMDVKCLLGTSTYAGTRQNVSMARRWVRELLSGHIDEETLYDVTLCAAELADNARKHGPQGGAISLQCISAVTSFGLRSPMML